MPVLDLEIWNDNEIIRHSFYKKSMSCPYVIMDRSAINHRTKRNTLLQEGLRRIRNMDQNISSDEWREVLSIFANTMRVSGYSQKVRYDTIKGIIARYKQTEEEITAGTRQRYRSGDIIRQQKDSKLGQSTNTWFLRGGTTCTLTVQCTPGSKLKTLVCNRIGSRPGPGGGLTRVIEESGESVMLGLKKSDPFSDNVCPFPNKCSTDSKTDCTRSRCIYEIQCNICMDAIPGKRTVYTGTTGCSLHKRLGEHMSAVNQSDMKNAIAKHMYNEHRNMSPNVTTSILGTQRFNLQRYVAESLLIEKSTKNPENIVMNSKGEWGRQKLTRIALLDNT